MQATTQVEMAGVAIFPLVDCIIVWYFFRGADTFSLPQNIYKVLRHNKDNRLIVHDNRFRRYNMGAIITII